MRSRILRGGGAVLALTAAISAHAQDSSAESPHHWTANVGLFSEYVFRGLTQTNERPAVQGGFDYSHTSGAYAGVWLSNVSWFSDTNAGNSNSLEWDLYGGFKKTWANGFSTEIGYLRYQYPGSYPASSATCRHGETGTRQEHRRRSDPRGFDAQFLNY